MPVAAVITLSALVATLADSTGRAEPEHVPWLMVLLPAVLIVPAGALALRSASRRRGRTLVLALLGALVLLIPAAARISREQRPPRAALHAQGVSGIEGRLLGDLRPSSDRIRVLTLQPDLVYSKGGWSATASGTMLVLWRGTDRLLTADGSRRLLPQRGDRLILNSDWPAGGGNVLWVSSDDLLLRPADVPLHALRRSLRSELRRRFLLLPARGAVMAEALLLGDRSAMPQHQLDMFRRAGAAHIIALSGMHLGVLAAILWLVLPRSLNPYLRSLIPAGLLFSYVWLAGWIPSLVRALILALLALAARARDRRFPADWLVAATVLVVALVVPGLLLEVGFQLSVWALAGLVLVSPRAVVLLQWIMPSTLARYLGTTLGPFLLTAPMSLLLFGSLYPVGLLSAGLLSLLVVVLMWSTLVWMLLAGVPLIGSLASAIVVHLSAAVLQGAEWAARLPAVVPAAAGWMLSAGLWCTLLAGLVAAPLYRRRRASARLRRLTRAKHQSQLAF